MTEATAIAAKQRTITGKANRRLATQGLIPAVVYGAGRDTAAIALDRHDFELFLQHHEGSGGLVEIELEGESKPIVAMIKQVQTSPVKGDVLHVDFHAVRMDQLVQTPVPLHLVGDAEGVKSGGVLLHNLHEIHVEALPTDLPDFIEADISALEVGMSLHIGDITPPAGVAIIDDAEAIVCSVTAPSAAPTEEELAAAAEEVEPEVIGEKSEE